MGTCGLLCLAGLVSVGVQSGALPGSESQARTVGAGWEAAFQLGVGAGAGGSSVSPLILPRGAFLLSQYSKEAQLGAWLSNTHTCSHLPASMLLPKPTWNWVGDRLPWLRR